MAIWLGTCGQVDTGACYREGAPIATGLTGEPTSPCARSGKTIVARQPNFVLGECSEVRVLDLVDTRPGELVVDRKPQALGRVRRRRIAVGHRIGERIVEREQLEKLKTDLLRGIAEQIRCLNTNRRRIERVASEKFDKRYFGATR